MSEWIDCPPSVPLDHAVHLFNYGCPLYPNHGYVHEKTILSSSGDPAHVAMPGVHRVVSLLKRWILGAHQGAIVPAHLQSYLEEFTFRFNRRTSRSRGQVFRRLIEQAATEAGVTFGYDRDGGWVSRS